MYIHHTNVYNARTQDYMYVHHTNVYSAGTQDYMYAHHTNTHNAGTQTPSALPTELLPLPELCFLIKIEIRI